MKSPLKDADKAKVLQIFRDLFDNPELTPTPETTAVDVPGWDSFNHINLVMMVEEEFNIRFTTAEISALENVGQFEALIASKIY